MEVPDITARICGICPVAYQMSAVHAMEDALGIAIDGRRSARCAGCSIAASGSRATCCTCTCCTRRISSATTARSRWPRTIRDVVRDGLALKKAGNEILRAARRSRDPPDQRAGRRVLPGARASASCATLRERSDAGARRRARDRALGRRASSFPMSSGTTSSSRCAMPASIRSTRATSCPTTASTSRRSNTTRISRNSTSSARTRCTRGISGTAPI